MIIMFSRFVRLESAQVFQLERLSAYFISPQAYNSDTTCYIYTACFCRNNLKVNNMKSVEKVIRSRKSASFDSCCDEQDRPGSAPLTVDVKQLSLNANKYKPQVCQIYTYLVMFLNVDNVAITVL